MATAPDPRIRDIFGRLQGVLRELGEFAEFPDRSSTPTCAPQHKDFASQQSFVAQATALMKHRQMRKQFLPGDLFREPGWDMMIAIYIADGAGETVNVKTLVAMVDGPATTSQRWIDHLDRLGLVTRTTDTFDRRRIEVSLTNKGRTAMESYLRAIGP